MAFIIYFSYINIIQIQNINFKYHPNSFSMNNNSNILFRYHKSLQNINSNILLQSKNPSNKVALLGMSKSIDNISKMIDGKINQLYSNTINNNNKTILQFQQTPNKEFPLVENSMYGGLFIKKSLLRSTSTKCEKTLLTESKQCKIDQSKNKKKRIIIKKQNMIIKNNHDRVNRQSQQNFDNILQNDEKSLILDKYSQIMLYLRNYKIADESPQFISFQRKNYQNWSRIQEIIQGIQKFAVKYQIPDGKLNTNVIVSLISQTKSIDKLDYLKCFEHANQISQKSQFKDIKYFGKKGRERAFIKIQSFFRMCIARNRYKRIQEVVNKIKLIQKNWRNYLRKKQLRLKIRQIDQQILDNHEKIQYNFKKQWKKIKNSQRVQIHFASSLHQQMKKLTTQKYLQKQNSQITRIFRLIDPLLQIIYISPFPIQKQLLDYYYKVLEIGQIQNCRSRLTFVWPEILLERCNLCYNLLYSPGCLKRINMIIAGRPGYIVPGSPDNAYIKIAQILKLPLYAGKPQNSFYFSTKSGSRSLVNQQRLLPYREDMYTKKDLIKNLIDLISENNAVQRWFFKIEDQSESRGNCFIDTKNLIQERQIQKKIQEIQFIENIIENRLKNSLKIVHNKLYENSQQFLDNFLTKGGIIEAAPSNIEGSIKCPGFFIEIEPNGQFKLLSQYSKTGFANKTIVYEFNLQQHTQLHQEIVNISKKLYKKDIFGFVNIQFMLHRSKFYFLGINCSLTNGSSSLFQAIALNRTQRPKFLYCPMIVHQGLTELHIKSFFHLCRLQNISFDIKRRIGAVFILLDSFQGGALGLLSMCDNRYGLYKYMGNCLQFLGKKLTIKKSLDGFRSDLINFSQIKNVIMGVIKKYEKEAQIKNSFKKIA